MANPSKAKGTAAETAVVNWLHGQGYPGAERLVLKGAKDQGDVRVRPGFHLEVKAGTVAAHPSVGQVNKWRDEAQAEAKNSGAACYLVTKRARSADPGSWLVRLTLEELTYLLPGSEYVYSTEPTVITLRSLVDLMGAQPHEPVINIFSDEYRVTSTGGQSE